MADTLAETQLAHAPLGPSSAEGWSTCSDYVNANRGLVDITSYPAAEGTAAHAISDICLGTGLNADDFLGIVTDVEGHRFAWEEDDAMLLQRGIDETRAMAGTDELFGERRVDISPWTLPGQFGTLDRAFLTFDSLTDTWWVTIIDLKWGRGVAVSPVDSKQLILYALGFWNDVARHRVPEGAKVRFRLIIDQPRHGGGGGIWETSLEHLLDRGDWLRERAALTALPNPGRTASLKGCMWCRRRRAPGGCDTYDTFMIGLLGQSWADLDMGLLMDLDMTLPRDLTADRRAYLLTHADAISRWLDQLKDECMADALAGNATGSVKAVLGNKAPDQWKKEELPAATAKARHHLGESGFTIRLKTPKQVLQAIGDDEDAQRDIGQHISIGQKKPILVPAEDARPPIAVADFDEEPTPEAGNGD